MPGFALPPLFLLVALMPIGIELQTTDPPSQSSPRTLTLTDCIRALPVASRPFLQEPDDRRRTPATGRRFQRFVGHGKEWIWRLGSKRVTIRGGLWPSANVAAQVGALDPAQEALARQPGSASTGTGSVPAASWSTRTNRVSGVCQ